MDKSSKKLTEAKESELRFAFERILEKVGGALGVTKDCLNDAPPESLSFFNLLAKYAGEEIHGDMCKDIGFSTVTKIPPSELAPGDLITIKTNVQDVTREISRTVGIYLETKHVDMNGEKVGMYRVLVLAKNEIGHFIPQGIIVRIDRAENLFGFSRCWAKIVSEVQPENKKRLYAKRRKDKQKAKEEKELDSL